MLYGALFLAELVLLVYCVVNIVGTPPTQVRTFPKVVWLVLVVLVPLVGGFGWLIVGRPLPAPAVAARPGAPGPRHKTAAPDDDEAFLRGLRARAEAQRQQAQREQAQREQAQREQAQREQVEHRPERDGDEPGA